MRPLLLFIPAFFLSVSIFAQAPAQGKLSSVDTTKLSVISVTPDSFPRVSLLFKAATQSGKPIWNLSALDLRVEENGQACKVVSLEKISKSKPVKVMLVVDHSGSMESDAVLGKWYAGLNMDSLPDDSTLVTDTLVTYSNEKTAFDTLLPGEWLISKRIPDPPAWYRPPFHYARKGVYDFIASMDMQKDSFGIVGFDDSVDYRLPLTQNVGAAHNMMEGMGPDGGTAFYDGVLTALKQFRNENDKELCAVIALTDGQDNSSHIGLHRLTKEANKLGIPVYVIGLGDVNKPVLTSLAKKTGGDCYFTSNAKKIGAIYLDISRRLQSVYELVYESPNLASSDTSRDVTLRFDVDSIYLAENQLAFLLPDEALARLKSKEKVQEVRTVVQAPAPEESSALPVLIAVTVAVAGAGVLIARSSKKRQQQQQPLWIERLYPNPANGPVTLETNRAPEDPACTLLVSDMNGHLVLSLPFTPGNSFDTSVLQNGTYLVQVQSSTTITPAKQLVINR